MDRFSGLWIPLVTPFIDNRLDLDAVQSLVESFARAGCAGVVVCGTTGEPNMLSRQEKDQLLRAVLEAAQAAGTRLGTQLGVVMGATGCDTQAVAEEVRHLSHRFGDTPLQFLLVGAPYYVRPSQEGIRQHFLTVAAQTDRPLVLYNIPYRAGVAIELDTLRRLAEHPQFTAIKESGGGHIEATADLLLHTPLAVLSGDDSMILVTACLGGHGAIAAAAHVRPDLFLRVLRHVAHGELQAARELFGQLRPLIQALFSEPNPGPLKAALALQGRLRDGLRLPMTPASAACRARLHPLLEAVEAIPA